MRTPFLLMSTAAVLLALAGHAGANPPGVPPNATEIAVDEGKPVHIDLGSPQQHGWYVKIWGSYKVGDADVMASGNAKEGENDPKSGCVYVVSPQGGVCFYPSENQGNKSHEFLKSVHGTGPFALTIDPPAGAHGALYYRLENAP
jgi:hypothetical protein